MSNIKSNVEAVLMAATSPVSVQEIASACETTTEEITTTIQELTAQYQEQQRGFTITQTPSGYRFITSPECYETVARFITEPLHAKLSPSALETLAVIAYKQPVSRGQITSIRGVNADGVVKTLESRGYIHEVARDSGPGQAVLYGTTPEFLERLGLTSIEELPSLGDFVPDASLMEQFEKSLLGEPAPQKV